MHQCNEKIPFAMNRLTGDIELEGCANQVGLYKREVPLDAVWRGPLNGEWHVRTGADPTLPRQAFATNSGSFPARLARAALRLLSAFHSAIIASRSAPRSPKVYGVPSAIHWAWM